MSVLIPNILEGMESSPASYWYVYLCLPGPTCSRRSEIGKGRRLVQTLEEQSAGFIARYQEKLHKAES